MHVHLTRLHRLGSKNTSKTEQQLQNIKVNKKKKKKKKKTTTTTTTTATATSTTKIYPNGKVH